MTALSPGLRLGPYEIIEPIGAGGMGEVYKAADKRLDRSVAIKVLPAHWAENPEMRQRFEREAQAIASLNHPNICVLHDIGRQDGIDFLVLEYLEGETLARRLERGALGLNEALKIGIAIADALDKAHRQGVVHRDLKPSNVMLTESGPKLLDFGLAKWKPSRQQPVTASQMPTGSDLTTPGAVLGTLQYMAPEQLEGIEADSRTDIFAFGALLHEMVTGRKAFEGKSQVLLMAAIATTDPQPLSKAQPDTPPALDHVVMRCLSKDPKDRWQTARDVQAELEWIAEGGAQTAIAAPVSRARRKRERLFQVLLAAATLFAAGMSWPAVLYFQGAGEAAELRFRVPLTITAQPAPTGNPGPVAQGDFAVSPDGRAIVYVTQGTPQEPLTLFVRSIGSVTPQRLAGTDGAGQPFWSADNRSIAFVAGGKLKKVEATGGPPQEICDAADFFGGDWNSDGTIVFGSAKGIYRVSAQGGKPEPLTTLDSAETGHFWPRFLPDGRHFLFLAWSGQATNRAVFAGTIESKEKTRVIAAESKAAYTSPGYLLFRREDTLYAQPFDANERTLAGEPVRVADKITFNASNGQSSFEVSRNGALAYFAVTVAANTGGGVDGFDRQLAWAERTGQVAETAGPPGAYRGLAVSPDGTRIAVHRHDGAGGDIFVVEPRGAVTQLTFDASHDNSNPVWSPDGKRIVYGALQKGKWGLYQRLSDGSGIEELLFESELPKTPVSWAPDGKRIVFWTQDPRTGGDLWVLPLDGDKKPVPFIATAFNETHGQVSPDGKWIAYTSNSTGGRNEIFVQPFPAGAGLWRVSTGGGAWPRWSRDGKELFYHSLTGEGPSSSVFVGPLYSAAANARGATFEAGQPRGILNTLALNPSHSGGDYHIYDVSPAPQRFLLFQVVTALSGAATEIEPDPVDGLYVALHWTSTLAGK